MSVSIEPHRPASAGLDWLFTADPKQRIRLRQTLLALGIVIVCVTVMGYAVWAGFAPIVPAAIWGVASVGGIVAAFIAIRLGLTRDLKDPSLSFAQIVWSIGCCATGYVVAGPLRAAVFPVLMIVMMFSMFRLNGSQVFRLAAMAVALLGLAMLTAARFDPHTFPPLVEIGHFAMVATMLPMVGILAERLAWLRRQRSELTLTLEKVREMASRDPLTGLANRRQMNDLIELAAASTAPFCLTLIDLDYFKAINDAHGHAVGDEVLRGFAATSLSVVRAQDVIGRWGGEEFVLLQPDAQLSHALQSIERLRRRAAEQPLQIGNASVSVTLSAGVAEHRPGETGAQTLARADAALYKAKHAGRNQVVASR